MSKIFILFISVVIFLVFNPGLFFAKESMSEKYPGPWKSAFNIDITKALSKNKIRGCGEYKYRKSAKFSNEYLVRCSSDSKKWSSYLVWPLINEVQGPFKPDPSLA